MSPISLFETVVVYLEKAGWYFDWERDSEVWGVVESKDRNQHLREHHCWTVPQWGEYWSSDHLHPKGPKPKTRRYESLQQALWSQLLREELPEQFETFFATEGKP